MEIFTVGEKIKRSRIYLDLTLKDLCSDKISVSKLSCIENNKVVPEDWILDFIAPKLNVDLNYLKQTTSEQISKNIKDIKNKTFSKNYISTLEYNYKYAYDCEYYNIAINILHLLFEYYIKNNELNKFQIYTSTYFNLQERVYSINIKLIYLQDMGRYFLELGQYIQSSDHFATIIKLSEEAKDYVQLANAIYGEATSWYNLKEIEKSYKIAFKILNLMQYLEDDLKRARAYSLLAVLSLTLDNGSFEIYEKKSYELYGNDLAHKAHAILNYAMVMFKMKLKESGIMYMYRSANIYPKDDEEGYVNLMLLVIKGLIYNNIYETVKGICEETLNYAIKLGNNKYIEKAYFYKSKIFINENDFVYAEMYMNLSLDSLVKCGSKSELYKRYIEIAYMYHNMGNIADSLEYFSLAISLSKRL